MENGKADGKIDLEFIGKEPLDFFPISYDNAHSLLFRISIAEEIHGKYESQIGEVLRESNPAWVLETITHSASYVLNEEYNHKYGPKGVLIYHAAEPPSVRRRNDYRFYLDARNEFLREKRPEDIRADLGEKIEKIIEAYDDIIELSIEHDRLSSHFEATKTKALFKL